MIYTIKNGKLTKYLSRNGQKFKKKSKKINTQKNKENHKFYNFYNSRQWHKLSKDIREREPLCRSCVREYHKGKRPLTKIHLASSVDHIHPLKTKRGWENRNNPKNLQPLCSFHHKRKNLKDHKLKNEF